LVQPVWRVRLVLRVQLVVQEVKEVTLRLALLLNLLPMVAVAVRVEQLRVLLLEAVAEVELALLV
jgi:hypothetical protein